MQLTSFNALVLIAAQSSFQYAHNFSMYNLNLIDVHGGVCMYS